MNPARLLSAALIAAPTWASAAPPFDAALAAYRAAPYCDGTAYWDVVALRDQAGFAFWLQDPAQARASRVKAMEAAAEANAIANTATTKGCPVQARRNWTYVLRSFRGTLFTPFLQAAVAGIRASHRP